MNKFRLLELMYQYTQYILTMQACRDTLILSNVVYNYSAYWLAQLKHTLAVSAVSQGTVVSAGNCSQIHPVLSGFAEHYCCTPVQ